MALRNESASHASLRLWPGVVIVLLQWLVRFVPPMVAPGGEIFGLGTQLIAVLAGPAGALALIIWWVFFSRARWSERLGAIAVMVAVAFAIRPLTHQSIQNGMMGLMFVIYAIPISLSVALVAWAALSRSFSPGLRWATMVAAFAIGCGVWTLARTDGILDGGSQLAWRWTPTAEERLLAQGPDEPPAVAPPPAAVERPQPPVTEPAVEAAVPAKPSAPSTPAAAPAASEVSAPAASDTASSRVEWSGFRGSNRDSVIHGTRINTDWSASPPIQMWRRPIGPGWSSFAVHGDVLFTQEQRGEDEIVAAYKVSTGEAVWKHKDATRFWESNGGPGPRATPTLHGNRVYTFGATGILNALDARTGAVAWSHNVASEIGRKVPDWGFASSPLVVDDVVIVAAAGTLVGYDLSSGKRRWSGPSHGGSYSSPHRTTIDGVEQVVLLGGPGAISVSPADGVLLWEYVWEPGAIVQPAMLENGDILVNTLSPTGGLGLRRITAKHGAEGWSVEERWSSTGLKPYFNDFVVHNGHAFGFDGNILACIDLQDGKRKWKGGRFGNGQLVLLADQDLLLVISEEGELALVSATPDKFTEVARFTALNSKTWNHPVLVRDVLLVRNGEEMAAFRLSQTAPVTTSTSLR